jgi:hypothetical protein
LTLEAILEGDRWEGGWLDRRTGIYLVAQSIHAALTFQACVIGIVVAVIVVVASESDRQITRNFGLDVLDLHRVVGVSIARWNGRA